MREYSPKCSSGVEGNVPELRRCFAVLKLFSDHTKCQCLHFGLGFQLRRPIGEHTGELTHLGDPSPVFFSIELDLEPHSHVLHPKSSAVAAKPPLPTEHPASPAGRTFAPCLVQAVVVWPIAHGRPHSSSRINIRPPNSATVTVTASEKLSPEIATYAQPTSPSCLAGQ